MAYTRKQLEAKSELELQAIGRADFQLTLDADTTPKAMMIDAIMDAQAVLPGKQADVDVMAAEAPPKKFRVIVHNQEGVDNTPFVAVGVNGFVYQIPREVEVKVPQPVVDILNQAEMTVPETDQIGRVVGQKIVKRFPFTVLGEAA